jgi:hypothetical protein
MGCIYHVFDVVRGMSYVGQTIKTLKHRKGAHLGLGKNTPFHNALRNRTSDFVWTTLFSSNDTEELDAAEMYWGKFFDCLWPTGYCLVIGSANGKMSEETKNKIRRSKTGKKLSISTRLSISKGRTGQKHSDETRKKMSLALRARNARIRQTTEANI